MHAPSSFLHALALVLCTAAVTTVLFQRLKLPVVLGYLLAGLIVGPHISVPLVADGAIVESLAELGIVLVMFSLGLEFSLRKLARVGGAALLIAVIQVSAMCWLGYITARQFGWSPTEAVFTGAALSISSTTIIAKAFAEHRAAPALRQLVFAELIVEDLLAILMLAALTTLQHGVSIDAIAVAGGKLATFLVGLMVVGLLFVPRTMRAVVRLGRPETTLVASIGLCFACALLANAFGYSVALGAFLAGSLVAESGKVPTIAPLVEPVRDVFAAVFFVAVGMLIDPAMIAEHWLAITVLTVVVIVGKLVGVSLGAFLAGRSIRTSVEAGMSMAQIGEFSFLIAGLGLSLGATGSFLYPVTVAVSAITTLTTPWMIRSSASVGTWIDRRTPRSLRTFETLYGTWLQSFRPTRAGRRAWPRGSRLAAWIGIDALAIVAIVVGVSLMLPRLTELLGASLGSSPDVSLGLSILAAAVACAPFAAGIAMQARRLAQLWSSDVFAATKPGALDLAAAPRRALAVALQVAILLACVLPIVAITQPFVPSLLSVGGVLLVAVALATFFWRSVVNLDGHVRAGSQLVGEVLARQSRVVAEPDLREVDALLPGLGRMTSVLVKDDSVAVGRSLGELDVHARSGATVVCLVRDMRNVVAASDEERLHAGDWIALTGSAEAVGRAREYLDPEQRAERVAR
jgi:CPA2 family monovalent cation:H+ antiporter-2